MIVYYLVYLALLSLITLILYGADKSRARRGLWRISEKALLSASLLGGALGGLLAMQLFRHKTKHWYFYAVNLLALCLHATVGFLIVRYMQ